MMILVRLVQSSKIPGRLFVLTLLLIVTLVRPVQPLKAFVWIAVTVSGIVILARLVHPRKAPLPMSVTPSGIVTLVRLLQRLKA